MDRQHRIVGTAAFTLKSRTLHDFQPLTLPLWMAEKFLVAEVPQQTGRVRAALQCHRTFDTINQGLIQVSRRFGSQALV